MSKVMTFSRAFPAYHPRAGQSTYFVEKIWKSLQLKNGPLSITLPKIEELNRDRIPVVQEFWDTIEDGYFDMDPKYHTIRAGSRWKAGDKFSPRIWSGKPYFSKQIIIAPDIEVKKVWDIEVDEDLCIWVYSAKEGSETILDRLAKNDGLSLRDLQDWFNKPMIAQIICWNSSIVY